MTNLSFCHSKDTSAPEYNRRSMGTASNEALIDSSSLERFES